MMTSEIQITPESVDDFSSRLSRRKKRPASIQFFKLILPFLIVALCGFSIAPKAVLGKPSASRSSAGRPSYAVAAPRIILQNKRLYQDATPTDTPLPTDIPTVTDTLVATDTPVATNTLVPTDTPTGTPLPTDTPVATDTPIVTDTPIATDTPIVTDTPTLTETPTPAGTPMLMGADSIPDNDEFANAISIVLPSFSSDVQTADATTAGDDPVIACASGGSGQQSHSVWYSYTPSKYDALALDTTGSDYDTVIAVWRGDQGSLIPVGCNENSPFAISFAPGYTYYIEIAQSGDGAGGSLVFHADGTALHGLRGEYFNNPDLSGNPVLTRMDPVVAFDWSFASPAPEMPTEHYSVRWTGQILAQYSETYTFSTYTDDGVRLWIDGQLLIDDWNDHSVKLNQAPIALQAGVKYFLRFEYYQLDGESVARLEWSSPSTPQAVVPESALDFLDVANSTLSSDGARPLADGVATTQITVTLVDSLGNRVAGKPVFLKISGGGNRIDGTVIPSDEWVQVGYSGTDGSLVLQMSSTGAGLKTVHAMAEGTEFGSPVSVVFLDGTVHRISVTTPDGLEGNGHSFSPSISNDGGRVAFLSWADDLVTPDGNNWPDVFVLDRGSNTLSMVSVSSDGVQANDLTVDPRISGNGQFVVFTSAADNLIGNGKDTNFSMDIFLYEIRDGQPGITTRVSVGPDGAQADRDSAHASISYDGRYIAFESSATNLVAGVTDGRWHIYLYDRIDQTTELIDKSSDSLGGEPGNLNSADPSVSSDGQHVVFSSESSNLIGSGNDNNDSSDIFLRDRSTGETTRISVAFSTGGDPAGISTTPSISDDGNRVAFRSNAGNLVSPGTSYWQIFLRDIPSGTTTLISISSGGSAGNNDSEAPHISADGMHVVFSSFAANLVSGDGNGWEDVFLRDLVNSQTVRISVTGEGDEVHNGDSNLGDVSSNGAQVVYQSAATDIVAGDTNSVVDIFLLERTASIITPTPTNIPTPTDTPIPQLYPVVVTVQDTDGHPDVGVPVTALHGEIVTDYVAITDEFGQATLILPADTYHFRADKGGTLFWSNDTDNCDLVVEIDKCTTSFILTSVPVIVTVLNESEVPEPNVDVFAYTGSTFTGLSFTTNAQGQASFTLPYAGSFRFRVTKNGYEFWSSLTDDCVIANNCTAVTVHIPNSITITVHDTNGNPEVGLPVRAYDGAGITNYYAVTNGLGQATIPLPSGNYHFRFNKNGTAFWSSPTLDCDFPASCSSDSITTNVPVVVTVRNGSGLPVPNLMVHAFSGTTFMNLSFRTDAQGQASFTLPDGSFRFRADIGDHAYWSNPTNHINVPGDTTASISVFSTIIVTVHDTNGNPEVGLPVRAYDGVGITNYFAVTNGLGQATVQLPSGNYHFRFNKNGTAFWSSPTLDCDFPASCSSDSITTNVPVIVTVRNGSGQPEPNLMVHAFTGTTFMNLSFRTDAQGQASFTLPDGSFRFRADKNNRPYWSSLSNDTHVPGDTTASISTGSGSLAVRMDQWNEANLADANALVFRRLEGFGWLGIA